MMTLQQIHWSEYDSKSEASVASLSRFIPSIPTPASISHIVSIGQLMELALDVSSQVATSPLPYNTVAGHCEALGSAPGESYPIVSIFTYISSVDSSTPDDCWSTKANLWTQNMYQSKNELCFVLTGLTYLTQIISSDEPGQEALMPPNACTAMKLPPASPFHNFL
ncbi:hypothetical protein KPL70_015588 [Citrus sinensis]|nr:hypothetical protein KPL70_015588 [Citrus sinensis]